MKKLVITIIVSLLVVSICLPSAFGFNRDTKESIIKDAVDLCPTALRQYLTKHMKFVRNGMLFVNRTDYKIDPFQLQDVYNGLVVDLKEKKLNDYNTLNGFGVMACYISEAINPGVVYSAEEFIPRIVTYDGYQEIGDIKTKTQAFIDSFAAYHKDRREAVTNALYNLAVNEIVDFWVTAWKQSGNSVGQFSPVGTEIEHKYEVIGQDETKKDQKNQNGQGAETAIK